MYLTADAEDVLETVEEGHAYVLDGLVGHNHYKVRRLAFSSLPSWWIRLVVAPCARTESLFGQIPKTWPPKRFSSNR